MKKILFLINTHFQLITALQISRTFYSNDVVDFLISDYSRNAEKIVENINNSNYIHRALFVKTKNISFNKNNINRIVNLCKIIRFHNTSKKAAGETLSQYDIFMFHNIDFATYVFFEELKSINNNLIVRRYEEGFNIYLSFNEKRKSQIVCEKYYKSIGKASLIDSIESVYLYHPELLTYKLGYPIKTIPTISKKEKEFIDIVNTVFGAEKSVYKEKFIIFEESFWADGYEVKDVELFNKIADIIVPNHVLIKLHPRNNMNRFINTKCNVAENSALPWEIIQMNNDFSQKVFVTVSSGSVLASLLYFDEKIPTVFLYKVIEGKFPIKPHYEEYLYSILKNTPGNKVYIPKNLDELNNVLSILKK